MRLRARAIGRRRSVPCRIVVSRESSIEIEVFMWSTLDDCRRKIEVSIGIPADHIELFRGVPPTIQITEQLWQEQLCRENLFSQRWPLCRMTVMLKVNITMVNGETIHVLVPVHATVLDVMRGIHRHTGFRPDQQRLCYGRFPLRRNELLTEYSIEKDPNVSLAVQQRGPFTVIDMDWSTSEEFTLWPDLQDTVKSLKAKLEEIEGTPAACITLYFKDRGMHLTHMCDWWTLTSCGLEVTSRVYACFDRVPGLVWTDTDCDMRFVY